jgi:Arc/MetJ-type ribon-helix-helix transcriptional regulator
MSEHMLGQARVYAQERGYENIQDFIREAIREKIHPDVSAKELALIKKLIRAAEEKSQFSSERELFNRLRKR